MTSLDKLRAELRDLLAGQREVVPWEHGETVYLYCGKACRDVAHTVMVFPNSNGPAVKPYALCGYAGCTRNAPSLPVRYRVSRPTVADAAARALPLLLDALDEHDPTIPASVPREPEPVADSSHLG